MDSTAQTQPRSMTPFWIIWSGQAVSLLGSRLVQFALIWWLTQATGSATVLAMASLVGLLPQVVFGPLAGTLVDRWNRRVTMIVADGVIALATVGLALLFWADVVQIWHVYLLMFVRAVAGGFHWPAMQASTSLMVDKKDLTRLQGFNQLLDGALRIVAAPLGALLLEVLPLQGVLAIDVGTALLAITPLFFIAIPQPQRRAPAQAKKSSFWQDFREGLRYVWAWPGLMMVLFIAAAINLMLTPVSSFLPLLVTGHFGGGALQLGWLESAFGIGILAGGLTIGVWGGFRRRMLTSLTGVAGLGLGILLVGLLPASAFVLAVGGVFFAGVMIVFANAPISATVQATVTPEMQGRVFTLMNSLSGAMTPLGLIVAGPAADALGVRTWYVAGGAVVTLIGLLSFFVPAVVYLDDERYQPGNLSETPAGLSADAHAREKATVGTGD
jgi:DHA3 family macrolide efflux protein-like MFS transporter